MPFGRWVLALLLCACMVGCGKQTPAPFSPPTKEAALQACKISSIHYLLRNSETSPGPDSKAIGTYFNSCMQKGGWRHVGQCGLDGSGKMPNPDPIFDFVKSICKLDDCRIATCFVAVTKKN
jgi:hypothetical protein